MADGGGSENMKMEVEAEAAKPPEEPGENANSSSAEGLDAKDSKGQPEKEETKERETFEVKELTTATGLGLQAVDVSESAKTIEQPNMNIQSDKATVGVGSGDTDNTEKMDVESATETSSSDLASPVETLRTNIPDEETSAVQNPAQPVRTADGPSSIDVATIENKSVPENTPQDVSVNPGEKDSEGFLPPPPASTLLIRRSRVGNTGATTYVISPSPNSKTLEEGLAATPVDEEEKEETPDVCTNAPNSATSKRKQSSSSGKPSAMSFQTVKRRPGRPVGSVGKYKKRMPVEPTTEVRTSERARARYDTESPGATDDSPWIYPTNFRASYLSGGKPPMTGYQGGYSKGKKHGIETVDPVTGKRKYMRRKKYGFDKRSYYRDDIEQGDQTVQSQHLSDKGIWRPTDDLRLIINTIATGDLESVYVGVKFSCFFSYKEIEERWRKLMYGEKASLVAQNAINALHPYVKAKIYFECLFSAEEEKLISSIEVKPQSQLDIKAFQTLLDENPHVFNKYRTPRSLMMHWQDMKDYHLHPNQDPLKFKPSEHFECFESLYNCDVDEEDDLEEPDDNIIEQEIQSEDRSLKKHIRLLEDETTAWQTLVDQMMNDGSKDKPFRGTLYNEFDFRTYAVLKGREVHFAMASREIVIGRATPESKVDANLVEESSCRKISRKQAVIRLKDMGRFVIINKGTLPIFVDRKIVPFKCAARLHDNSVIQVGSISLVFVINRTLINHIVEQDMQREIYESFKDLEKDYPPVPNKPCNTPAASGQGKGKLGKSVGYEGVSLIESKAKPVSKQLPKVGVSSSGVSSSLEPGSHANVTGTSSSNYLNLDAAIAKEASRAVPPSTAASNVTPTNSGINKNAAASTSDDITGSNFTVPIITSVSSLSQKKQESVPSTGHQSVFEAYSAYSMYIPHSSPQSSASSSTGNDTSSEVMAKPK